MKFAVQINMSVENIMNIKNMNNTIEDYNAFPDASGHFGIYGGSFVAETLMAPLAELTEAYDRYRVDPQFIAELKHDYQHYVGRPSPIYEAFTPARTKSIIRLARPC